MSARCRAATRLVRRLRELGRPLSPEEAVREIFKSGRVVAPERILCSVIDGRFWLEREGLGLWEWRNTFPPQGQPLVVFDLETTGLSPKRDEIIEIALVRLDGGERTVFQQLIDPGRPIPPFISRLTGIHPDSLIGQPDVYQVLEQVAPLLEQTTFMIQNAPFDLGFLRPRLARLGVKLEGSIVDTVQLARRALPELQRRGLDQLMEVFGVQLSSDLRHRALGDAEATLEVGREMYFMLSEGKPRRLEEV